MKGYSEVKEIILLGLSKFEYKKIILVAFSISLILGLTQNAYAVPSSHWDSDYYSYPDFQAGHPLKVRFDVTDVPNGSFNETVSIQVKSFDINENQIDSLSFDLTEIGDSGVYGPIDKIVWMTDQDVRFDVKDSVKITLIDKCEEAGDDDGNCNPNVVDVLSGASNDSVRIWSDTTGNDYSQQIPIDLVETGQNTGEFTRTIHFVTSGTSDSASAKLLVSPGDRFSVVDSHSTQYTTGLINGGKNNFGLFVDPEFGHVDVYVNGEFSSSVIMLGPGWVPGRGGGGLIKPGLVLDFLLGGGTGFAKSIPPTLGLDILQHRIVEDGFSFNGNPVDVNQYYTPYPLITTPVGQNNTIKLKIYEDRGIDNIEHVGISYGLGKGETFNEGRATIEYDRKFDGTSTVSTFDPHHVLGAVNVTTSTVNCNSSGNAQCLEVAINHMFRAPLEYNMVATNIWDYDRNGWQNYFNHGIEITGKSMNPPEQYTGIYKGNTYILTETGKNTAIDENGNAWSFDKTWTRDFIEPQKPDKDIMNPDKLWALEHLGKLDYTTVFGYERWDHRFSDEIIKQNNLSQEAIKEMCPKCIDKEYDKINNIFSYQYPSRLQKLEEPKVISQMNIEDQKAKDFLKEYFAKMYPEKVDD